LCAITPGQGTLTKTSGSPGELFGGIELSNEGVKAIALQVSKPEGIKMIYSDMIRLRLGRTNEGEFPPQASVEAAQAVSAALERLQQEYKVPLDRIWFVGASGLSGDYPKDLVSVIRDTTGLTLKFLGSAEEVQLSIAGTITRTSKQNSLLIDNRNTSVLLSIGYASTQAGCEILKYSSADSPSFDYIAMNIPHGVVSYANEVSKAVGRNNSVYAFARQAKTSGASSFRQALRKELENKPILMHRKRVFLTGNLAWAMTTLLYPQERQPVVPLTYEDIVQFAEKIARAPEDLAFQKLTFIRDKKARKDAEQELAAVRATFTPKELIAGAEMLRAAAEELKWQEKKILFVRFGYLGSILSYVRLQTGK